MTIAQFCRYNTVMTSQASALSIIIPTLNEETCLPLLLDDLRRQQNIQFDIIVVDGGSADKTAQICRDFASRYANSLSLKFVTSAAGRAIQMNLGAKHSTAEDYLFLHADSRLRDQQLLSKAQQHMDNIRQRSNHQHIAGHFPARFVSNSDKPSSYYFYACKTHLNRPDCINGDQGYWISKHYFNWLGQFDESLPYMEDARLALKIFDSGQWVTLPGHIETSARRFEIEGFTKRQILNAFLCNFNVMGVSYFFHSALDVYRSQSQTSRLQLRPFLKLAHQQMNGDGITTALQRWYQTGAYIASNAWQLAFAIDCHRNRKRGLLPCTNPSSTLQFYDRHLASVSQWSVVKALTGVLTVIWFYCLFLMR